MMRKKYDATTSSSLFCQVSMCRSLYTVATNRAMRRLVGSERVGVPPRKRGSLCSHGYEEGLSSITTIVPSWNSALQQGSSPTVSLRNAPFLSSIVFSCQCLGAVDPQLDPAKAIFLSRARGYILSPTHSLDLGRSDPVFHANRMVGGSL